MTIEVWDPFAEDGYGTIIEEPLPRSRERRILVPYIINVPQPFYERWGVTKQIIGPPGFEYDGRSSPVLVDRVLPRWSIGTPADLGHDLLYRATRTLNWLVEQRSMFKTGDTQATELSEFINHYRLLLSRWSRRAADAFYFEHRKAIAHAHDLPLVTGWPIYTRYGQFFGRLKSWAGTRIGGWCAWQANQNMGYSKDYGTVIGQLQQA